MVARRVPCACLALLLTLPLAASACGDDGAGLDQPLGGAPRGGMGGDRVDASGGADVGGADSGGGGVTATAGRGSGGGSAGAASAGSGGVAGGGGSDAAPGAPGVGSAGCGRAPGFQSGAHTLEVGGLTRSFILDVPGDYARERPYPLVFGFHGRDFSAEEFRSPSYGDLPSAIGAEAVVVYPDATDVGAWELESEVDLELFDALLATLGEALCIDSSRVFATGHSSGGYFTNLLGCRRGDVLRAIAPVAGGVPPVLEGGMPACTGSVSVWLAHGEDDQTVPLINGESSRDEWLARGGCDAEGAAPVAPAPCVAYAGCAAGAEVRWCAYAGGHDWPSFAAPGLWGFFASLAPSP